MVVAELLREAGFTGAGVEARVGAVAGLPPLRDLPVYELRLGEPDELGSLIRLLLLERSVPSRLLGTPLAAALVDAEIATTQGERLQPRLRLASVDGLLIASDLQSAPPAADFVPGVQGPSRTLARLTPRRDVGRALDVGTGCGYQALLAARHANRVVATDVNERALRIAALNARLNGITNVELRAGSFFEPVAGEEFDLVVSNPPYVISPDRTFVFRDGTLDADGVSEHVVRSLPAHLRRGGFGVVLAAWCEREGVPQRWLDGCDAILFRTARHDALTAAAAWNGDEPEPAAYAAAVDRWLAYFARHEIRAIGYGGIVARKGGGRWREVALSGPPRDAVDVELLFAAHDYLASSPDLLHDPLALASGAALVRERSSEGVRWHLRREDGAAPTAVLDDAVAELVERLDACVTAADVASRFGIGDEAVLGMVRELVANGFLTPRSTTECLRSRSR